MRSANEMRQHLCAKAAEDADFRARLLASPKSAIQQELSVDIPESFEVQVHEDGPTTAHLVLPPTARLTEAELRAGHGGWTQSSTPTNIDPTYEERVTDSQSTTTG